MEKRGSITSRTLEKLGLNSFRLRSNSQPTRPPDLDNDKENKDNGNTERCDSADTLDATTEPNVNDNKQNQDHKKSLKERLWNYYHRNEDDEKKGSSLLYVDYSKDTMVTTDKTGDKNANEERHNSDVGQEKRKRSAPVGTIQYTVKDRETIESIAAHFDTTPSQLKKVNRLISPMIFAGQVIYIPDKDYVPPPSARSSISSEPMDTANKSPQVTPVGSPEIRPTMDVPMVRAANKPPDVVPGHAERSPTEEVEFEIVPPTKLSADEVQQLDQDCMERFIKLKVKHITDGQGVVKGTLLVTPNAVMFDPDVLDPLVVEHGAEKYGMIAPMDMIISAAMYHDIAVMKLRGKVQPDGTMYPKPEVYHDKTCPLYKARQNSKDNEVEDSDDKVGDLVNLAETKRKIFSDTKSDSVCSCGGIDNKEKDALLTLEDDKLNEPDALGGEVNHGRNADEANDTDIKGGELLSTSGETEMQHMECDKTEDVTNTLDVFESSSKKTSSPKSSHVAFCLADVESSRKQNAEVLSEDVLKTDNSVNEIPNKSMNRSDVFEELDKVTRNTDNVNEDKDTDNKKIQIGSIVYLPVEEDSEGKVTLQSLEATQNTLSKLSTEAFEQTSKSETNLAGNFPRSENQDIEKKRSASTSSLGPFSPSPHLSAFVNYATGFFSRTESQKEIKDIQDVVPDFKMEEPKRSSDIPVIAAAPTAGKRRGKISRHSNSNQEVEVESAMKMTEKLEDLFSVDYDKFKPRKSVAYSDPPLYLCLRLGMPQNKVFHNYSIESYGKRRKKSEYWFSIPREKVDHLYAFFVQWTPEIYGDQEDIDPEKRGFVVIPDNEDGDDDDSLEVLDEYFGQNSVFHKDWEIISKIEAIKRRSIVFEEPLPLPELNGQSTILDDALILQLSQVIPPRTVGYPWTLIYSTDKHGFSLKTLYRDMAGLDSPILLVVKDTQDHVFGALTSCELKISDHFYGTGETFLYTFYPEFQVFNWSGDNNFFMKGNKESLSIGAGQGVFGLWFDGDLYHGRTHKCDTFNNDMLTSSEDFVVKAFEAWAFVQD